MPHAGVFVSMATRRQQRSMTLAAVICLVVALCMTVSPVDAAGRVSLHKAVPVGLGDAEPPEQSTLKLTKLIVINRHGHRAPNAQYWTLCPNDIKNREAYNVDSEDLSVLGMKEEMELGQYLRTKYHTFIGDRFNRTLHFFRAVGEPRILQSAVAVAHGIFLDGYGPRGFLPSRPQLIPIFSDMPTHEYLLDNVPCFGRAERDVQQWLNTTFNDYVDMPIPKKTIALMKDLCGEVKGRQPLPFVFIKTVADGITFNTDLGLKIAGRRLKPAEIFDIRNLSTHLLLERLYYSDEQQTYTSVDLPRRLIRLFQHRHVAHTDLERDDYHELRQTSDFFFVHREAIYALAQFFGIKLSVIGLPQGEIPAAASLIFEQLTETRDHKEYEDLTFNESTKKPLSTDKKEEVLDGKEGVDLINATSIVKGRERSFIKLSLWTPYNGKYTLAVPGCVNPYLCEVEELHKAYQKRIERTGTWEELCNFTKVELDKNTDIR